MIGRHRVGSLVASAALALALASPAAAQGKGGGKGHKSTPPSQTVLPSPAVAGASPGAGASPLAWIDDATILSPGAMSLSISALRWQGADLSEVVVPVVDASLGLGPRVQLGASVPRIAGSADLATSGGLGTSFVSVKIALPTGGLSGLKLAVAPTLEILGNAARESLQPGSSRTQLGLPVSAEVERGAARLFGSAGYFSPGVWFGGFGVGAQASPRVAVSVAFSRAWVRDDAGVASDRREISGGAAYSLTPQISLFGSLGRTVATTDENGAGTTIGGGVSFLLAPAPRK